MEEVLLRFHYVGQKIFEQLDNKTLGKCGKVGRAWKTFLDGQKFQLIRKIKSCSSDPNEPLDQILKHSNVEEVKNLANIAFEIRKIKKRNYFGKGGQTSLHFAAASGQREVFKRLLIKAKGISPKDNFCRSPAHFAAEYGQLSIYQLVVENVVHKNPKDYYKSYSC